MYARRLPLPRHFFHRPAGTDLTCARGWQYGTGVAFGGGLYLQGPATLTDTNVYKNQAGSVCSPAEPFLTSHVAPHWNATCAHVWQNGGGLIISWDGSTATLTGANVYENQATEVCSPVEPCLSSHPAPRWNVTCAHGSQNGGGLFIGSGGAAMLTETNVYENQAYVCSPVEPSF